MLQENESKLISFLGEEDNSESFFNKEINEAYHSKVGPIAEALNKFVKPSCAKELLLRNKELKVLDLFFGLGYNTGVLLNFAYELVDTPKIEIIAIEKDIEIIKKIKELKVPTYYEKWKNLLAQLKKNHFVSFENINIRLQVNDIFEIINNLPRKYFDVIFFDPFSHKSTPWFWTEEFFKRVLKLLSPGGTLTTYSGLKRISSLASTLGFNSVSIPGFGRKKPSMLIKN